jgi:hypothetical protein
MRIAKPSPAMVVSCIALFISLGVAARAANTVFSTDIVDGEVKQVDLASNSVTSSNVYPNSLLLVDLAGADVSGHVYLSGIPDGRCQQVTLTVSGAKPGDVPVIATQGSIQSGVFIYAMQTPSLGHVVASVCNMSGTAMTPINGLPVRIVTFR